MRLKQLRLLSLLAILVAAGGVRATFAQQNAPAGAPAQAGQGGGQGGQRAGGPPPPPMRLMSGDIADGKPIAGKFTCAAGADAVSPALQWMQAPRGTESFALIVHFLKTFPLPARICRTGATKPTALPDRMEISATGPRVRLKMSR